MNWRSARHKRRRAEYEGDSDSDSDSKSNIPKPPAPPKKNSINSFISPIKLNHIYFNEKINRKNILQLCQDLGQVNQDLTRLIDSYDFLSDHEPIIYLHLSSMGGSVFEALKAIDYLRLSTFPVYTIVEGYVASATTLLSIFGQRRLITKHSRMLIHQISNSLYGWLTMHELEDEYINAQELTDQLIQIYVDKTKMTRKQLEKFFKHDRWWSAQECLEKGLVDQII